MSSPFFNIDEIRILINDALNNGVIERSLGELTQADIERAVVEFGGLTDPIGQLESWIASQLQSFGNWLVQSFQSIITPIVNAMNTVASYVNQGFSSLSSVITQSFQSFSQTIQSSLGAVATAFSNLQTAFTNFASSVSSTLSSFQSALTNAFSSFSNTLTSFTSSLSNAIQSGFSSISTVLTGIGNQVTSALSNIVNAFNKIVLPNLQNWVNGIVTAIQQFAGNVQNVFTQIGNYITDLWNGLQGFGQNIVGFFNQVGNEITGFFKGILTGFEDVGKAIQGFFSNIQQAFNAFGTFMAQGFQSILNAFTNLGKGIESVINDVVNVFSSIPQVISEIPENVFKAVYQAFLDFLKTTKITQYITPIINLITTLGNWFGQFGTDLTAGFKYFYGLLMSLFKDIQSGVQGLASDMIGLGKSFASFVSGFVGDFSKFAQSMTLGLVYDMMMSPFMSLSTILSKFQEPYVVIKSGVDPEKVAIPNLLGAITTIVSISIPLLAGAFAIGKAVESLGKALGEQEIDLSPIGLGVKLKFKPGELLEPIGDAISALSDEVGRALVLSGSLAYLEPLRYIGRYLWWLFFYSIGLGNIPIEIPSFHEVLDIARRFDITKMLNNLANVLIFRGFPYWMISRIIALPSTLSSIAVSNDALADFQKELQNNYIVVYDKFGNARYIPLAPIFDLPTTHDLVEFMLRDLFLPASVPPAQQPVYAYKSFIKAMWARGIPPDVAYMYYLRAYELPSATQVWDFTMRAISGFAWYVPPPEVIQFAQSEAQIINAFTPRTPAELNFDYETALLALAEYQKWHGRAHFAWININGKSYTSDAWLIIDQSAHLLDRGDIEHLVRFGMMDWLSQRGVTTSTTLPDMPTKILDPTNTSPLTIDTTFASRAFVARGFHPYITPLIALRDVLDVTTAPKTLLRTGLINLIRENLEPLQPVMDIMSGFFNLSIKTAYFDMKQMKWVEGWLNVPVYYIEPEKRLLLLRSVMDKAVLYIRNMFRAVLLGVRDYLISLDESINAMKNYVTKTLDTWYAPNVKLLTGKEMHLLWDDSFNNAITQYFSIEQTIGTYRRIRYYARYALYRVLALLGYGVIPQSDIPKYVDELVQLMRETPQARDVFMFISELVYRRYLLRNYEYMARIYLERHAILPNDALNMLIKNGIDPQYAQAFVQAYSVPYYPTITQLITMSEYLPQALSKLPQVMALMRIPNDWVSLWNDYAVIRAYIRWFTRELNELITLVSTIPQTLQVTMQGQKLSIKQIADKVFSMARDYGFDDTKLNFIKAVADMRYAIREYHNSVPTSWHALNLSYYVPDPDSFLDNVLSNVIINSYGTNLIKTLARFRRYSRWMWETVYWAVRAFARGYIDGQTLYQFLQSLQPYGLSKYDIDMIRNFAFAVSCYYGACTYPW